MTKKLHPSEIHEREQIARADSFSLHLRRGPDFTINEEGFETLALAIARAEQIEAVHKGRPVLIYAITPENRAFLIPADMRLAARKS